MLIYRVIGFTTYVLMLSFDDRKFNVEYAYLIQFLHRSRRASMSDPHQMARNFSIQCFTTFFLLKKETESVSVDREERETKTETEEES